MTAAAPLRQRIPAPSATQREALLYLAMSGVALALDTGVFTLSLSAGASVAWAGMLGFSLGLAFIYAVSTGFVFRQHRLQNRRTEFAIFGLIGVLGLGLTQALLWLFALKLHIAPLTAKLMTAGGVFVFNFTLRKALLFTRKPV